MIEFQPCTIVFVCGPVRSGKTFLIDQWCKKQSRIVRFDATGETTDDSTMEHIWYSPRSLARSLQKNPYAFRLAYHPGNHIRTDFEWCSKGLWLLDTPKVLVCDEFHEVCAVNDTPEWVQTILRYTRHDKLGLIAASQRIPDVHKLFTSGCNMSILFHTTEARDLGAIEDRWRCADMVENLRPLIYEDLTKKVRQIPQCVVIQKGTRAKIYDFKTNQFLSSASPRPVARRVADESPEDYTPSLPDSSPISDNEESESNEE